MFKTHTGKVVTGQHLIDACKQVADDMRISAKKVKEENKFASHVTEKKKEEYIHKFWYSVADRIERGYIKTFSDWQSVNQVLTGECIGLLP